MSFLPIPHLPKAAWNADTAPIKTVLPAIFGGQRGSSSVGPLLVLPDRPPLHEVHEIRVLLGAHLILALPQQMKPSMRAAVC
jgi:hypothetical protein